MAPEVADRLWPAWQAVQERDEFEVLRQAIESTEYDDGLDRAGLSGAELDFKLAGVDTARTSALETPTPQRLKRLLAWLDVVLGSLLAVIGAGEGIKELKEGRNERARPAVGVRRPSSRRHCRTSPSRSPRVNGPLSPARRRSVGVSHPCDNASVATSAIASGGKSP